MSTSKPLLTVGLPVFNGERYLGNAIECILSQSFQDYAFIISDNASTDGTEEICRHYAQRDRRIRYHRNSVNIGGAKNSDLILGLAETEFFATASHDDYFSLNYLEACLAKLRRTDHAMLCCPQQVVFLDPRGNPTRAERNCNTEGKDLAGRMHELVKKLGWYAWYGVTRTETLRSLLADMRRYRYAYGGDVIFMATALLRGHIVVVPGTTFFYREPDRAKEFSAHMNEILPGSEAPARPYTGLARDILQVLQDSNAPMEAKTEASREILKTIANEQEWVTVLTRENSGAAIGELASGLPRVMPIEPRVKEYFLSGGSLESDPARKLRLAVVAPFPVCSPVSGGEQRIFHLYQGLLDRCDVDVITITGPDVEAGQFTLGPGFREIRLAKSRMHLQREVTLNRAAGVPVEDIGMTAWIGETPEFVDILRKTVAGADLVCVSQPYLFPVVAQVWSGPVVYDAHRVELDYKRQTLPDSPVKDTLLKAVEQVERACATSSVLTLCGSMEDKSRLNELYGIPLSRLHIVPNGYVSGSVPFIGSKDRRARMETEHRPPIAFFSGSYDSAGVQAVEHIRSFASELPDIQFVVAGRVCEAYSDSGNPKNFRFVGPISDDDTKRLLALAAVALYPLDEGTGTARSMVECFAAGVPVISTREGVRGLDVADRRHCRICDIVEFPSAIRRMAADLDAEDIRAMVDQACAYAKERFDWSMIARRLLEETNGLMKAVVSEEEKSTALSAFTLAESSQSGSTRNGKGPLGVNVIAHVSGNLGLGVTARNVVRTLIDRGCAVSILDLDPGLGRGAHDKTYQDLMVASADQLPHDVNLFVLPPTAIAMLHNGSRQLFSRNTLNIAFTMWELPVVPATFRPALESLDFIIAESEYIRHTFQCHLSGVHTGYAPHPLYVPEGITGERSRFGVPEDSIVFVTGFEPYSDVERKNTRSVIDAFRRSCANDPRAYLLIKVNNPMEKGRLHVAVTALQAYARGCDRIRFITDSFTYEEVLRLYAAADVFVSLHRAEGLGLGMMEAMALGKPVIATGWSGNLSFMDHRCACLVGYRLIPVNGTLDIYRQQNLETGAVWADPDIEDAADWMRRLADDPELRRDIGEKARASIEEFQRTARRGDFVEDIEALRRYRPYRSAGGRQGGVQSQASDKAVIPAALPNKEQERTMRGALNGGTQRPLRILFQNRSTAKSHPGGDTVVMDALRRELQQLGHRVDIALGPADLGEYDLVQAFNFATPEITEEYARRAVAANVPLIVAAIYEDWPLFLNQSREVTEVLCDYLQNGRSEASFRAGVQRVRRLPPAKRAANEYAARHAACLLAWSESEKHRLLNDYPDCRRVEVITLGADHLSPRDVDSALFEKTYGVKDFVLCVGRLETRKNQLMLLKALEHDTIPIVFLTGGFSYQPNYVKLCRMFDRPGKTLFLDRVSDDMLAAAYRAARVLCMPSWYELPGLVALEALRFGCPVVASRWGTLPDYVPHGVEYCEPDDPDDIRGALLRSYQRRDSGDPRGLVRDFRWRESAARLVSVYEHVLRRHRPKDQPAGSADSKRSGTVSQGGRDGDAGSSSKFACSIIMPISKDVESTRRCLTAISESTQGVEYEVIIIDNARSDDMQELLGNLGGDVQIIRNREDAGFAKACNQGAHAAQGEYLVFLDHDAVPLDGWLRALVGEVDGHPEVAAVGCKQLYPDGTVRHAGMVFDRTERVPYHIYEGVPGDTASTNQRREYQAVSGACLLIRRSIFMEVGEFDEALSDGVEIVDLCLKVGEQGSRVVYQPRCVVRSLGTGRAGSRPYGQARVTRLPDRWGAHWWVADEDVYYHADGYKLVGSETAGESRGRLQLIEDIKDRAAWSHVAAAQAAALKKDWNGVKRELSLVQDWPGDPSVLSWAAMVCEKLDEPALRHTFLTRYLELNDSPTVRRSLVRSLLAHKSLAAAEQQLKTLLAGIPDDAEGLLLRGLLCIQREQYREAETAFEMAMQHGADRKKCLMGMGMASLGRAYAQGAWERFLEVLADNPDDADAIHWLLRAGTAQNRWEDLSRHLRAYVLRNPRDLATRFALAGVLLRADQIEEARREHDNLRAAAPTYDGLGALEEAIVRQEAVLAMEAAQT